MCIAPKKGQLFVANAAGSWATHIAVEPPHLLPGPQFNAPPRCEEIVILTVSRVLEGFVSFFFFQPREVQWIKIRRLESNNIGGKAPRVKLDENK